MAKRLQKIRKKSLKDQVINAIRNAIIDGKFRAGEKIPELELAEQLGVSRTPIREAFHILEQQGLVMIVPKTGTYVADVDPAEVEDSLYTRIVLEEFGLQQAIERSSTEEWDNLLKKLNRILKNMKDAVKKGNMIEATELDIEWHTILIEAAKNRYLSRVWSTTGLQFLIWSPERNIYPGERAKLSDITYTHHQELFDALRTKDAEVCSRAIRTHILQRLSSLEPQLNNQPGNTTGKV